MLVHHRGLAPAAGPDTAVVLLRRPLPADPTTWAATPAPDLTGLAAALDALPADTGAGAAPGALPGYVPTAGWTFADAARPARRPATAVAAGAPVAVAFDVDLGATNPANASGADVLLLALVHRRDEPVTLPSGGLRDAVLASSHASARSLRLV
ncbi:hypothetical protein GCM10025868_42350 [Angustibacter aerolatus]|uniref:Uncharacterized protein n=1 Tax=Angustibacter aerolatus TaxID=1162965 RepID=A0ABQ6JNZ3_9ACTN|nr:hypothetical protein GCM10025868_42350 [Angustibacter aerolatus]